MQTTIRTSEPRELLALIPFQLGFAPQESVVLVSVRRDRQRVGLVARVDLADLVDPARGPALARTLVRHLREDGAERLVLVLYTADDLQRSPGAGRVVRRRVAAAAGPAGLLLAEPADCWVVTPTGYYAHGCTDAQCCPPGGRPLTDLQATEVGAHMVLEGACVARSRSELGRIVPASPEARRAARRSARRWSARRDAATDTAAVHRWRLAGLTLWRAELARRVGAVSATDVGRLQVALADVLVRDAVMLGFLAANDAVAGRVLAGEAGEEVGRALAAIVDPTVGVPPEQERAAVTRALLETIAAHAPVASRAPAVTLLAVLAWWDGDGARAAVLVEQALAADPSYRLAALLDDTLAAGMPPGWLAARPA